MSSTSITSDRPAPRSSAGAPATSRRAWSRVGVLWVLGAVLSAVTIRTGINPHDEGLVLQAAARIADQGQVPYRDFYANYGPGPYYLAAALHVVFGPSLLTWRILRVALDATVAVLAYALARRDAPEPLALGAWLAVAAAMAFPSVPGPNPPAVALGLGALLLVRRAPAGAGALAGLAIVFRIDAGLATVVGVVLAAFAAGGRRPAARVVAVAAVAAAALLAPVVLASPRDFWDQTLGFALDQQGLQRLPLPGAWHGGLEPNKLLHFYVVYVLLAGALLWVVLAVRTRAPLRLWAPAPLALAGVGYVLARDDQFHLVPLAAVLPVLLATVAARDRAAGRRAGLVAAVVVLALIALDGLDKKRVVLLTPGPLAALHVDVADGVRAEASDARALDALVPDVRSRVPPGQPVFVANPRYDLVNVGDPLLYVLLGRSNPTRYDVMQPGVVTTAPVQREMARDLERARPRVVIRWLSPVADYRAPDAAGRSSGVRILDRYLAAHYAEVRRLGFYAILLRRPG